MSIEVDILEHVFFLMVPVFVASQILEEKCHSPPSTWPVARSTLPIELWPTDGGSPV